MYDIIIVGAGPAGLTAALFALRANKKVLLLESKTYGGQIIKATKIENYPAIDIISGYDFATNLYNQVMKYNGEIKYETVLRVEPDKTVITNENTYKAKAVILATGSFNRRLNIENEDKYSGKGVSYCASCDGNLFKGKIVAVIGAGNAALNDAYYLADLATKVYIVNKYPEFKSMTNYEEEINKKGNIEVIYNALTEKINGDGEKLTSIDIVINNEEKKNMEVDGVFIAIGQEPKNELFTNVVDVNERGYIISEDGVHTKTEGIYVAGDTRVKELRQLTTAVADGSLAATIAIKELK